MAHLASFISGWLIGALLIGFGTGWISVVWRGQAITRKVGWWIVALAVALVALAAFKLVPGRFGYALDLALIMVALYLVGCSIGSWLRDIVVRRQISRQQG